MARTYGDRDRARGREATVAWLAEELGELARAVRKGTPEEQLHELGDVLAWLASLADQLGLSLDEAASRARATEGPGGSGVSPGNYSSVPVPPRPKGSAGSTRLVPSPRTEGVSPRERSHSARSWSVSLE